MLSWFLELDSFYSPLLPRVSPSQRCGLLLQGSAESRLPPGSWVSLNGDFLGQKQLVAQTCVGRVEISSGPADRPVLYHASLPGGNADALIGLFELPLENDGDSSTAAQ